MKSLLSLVLLSIGVESCSVYCPPGSDTFGSSMARAGSVVQAWIQQDISPPINPLMPWGTRYYQGDISQVFKDNQNIKEGKLFFSGGACGSPLPVNVSIVLFGEVQERNLDTYATSIPVFVPISCTTHIKQSNLTDAQLDRVENYDASAANPCIPQDCAEVVASRPQTTVNCLDGTTRTKPASCALDNGICTWDASPPRC